ncbi:DUF4229 domain-containing protein [Nocardioides sp. T2.26MG-1]|uniref:DUF4229 domain-containing protein n=1 Tax=Nocardioides sp. T2.26MG-1 TaxID=3041166 RepID=UPI0025416E58|nr:DUF4229 domain-containing protein [Nocardioides sp. T2.26MG-1]
MKEFWIYTGLRFLLFVGSLALIIGVWFLLDDSVPILWAIVLAFVLSGVGSYFLLNGPRDAFARRVETRAERMSAKIEELRAKEDADDA